MSWLLSAIAGAFRNFNAEKKKKKKKMTAYEKAHAIFYWIKGQYGYYDLDEAEDWQGTAIETLAHIEACFNYFLSPRRL